ncbi:MAG: heme peroxidase [Pirellulaceae bacterium]|nr:MAG: heme peroxidase [Pirellulaceae bacterium]
MSRPVPPSELPEPGVEPTVGWHCLHLFYRFDRSNLAHLSPAEISAGTEVFLHLLDPQRDQAPVRMQSFLVAGHKADFGLILFDPDPLKLQGLHQQLMAGPLGRGLSPTYSFVSLTEISEYVPSPEQYAERLKRGGEDPNSPAFAAKVAAYEKRLPMMNAQRLTPDLPDWPALCFYPMNKSRVVGANWFTTPFSRRNEMMAEHAQSGMLFAGRVTQIVTVSVGLDDWEWGVTLWARRPDYLKDIVYRMRFDEASAKYGEFGSFYTGYRASAADILRFCGIGQ